MPSMAYLEDATVAAVAIVAVSKAGIVTTEKNAANSRIWTITSCESRCDSKRLGGSIDGFELHALSDPAHQLLLGGVVFLLQRLRHWRVTVG